MSLLIHDSNLISTREASALSGYHSDYLGRLCREGKIEGSRVGRAWIVNRASLEAFIEEQERAKRENAEKLSRSREEEYRAAQRALAAAPQTAPASVESPYAPVPSPYPAHPARDKAVAALLALASVGLGLSFGSAGAVEAAAGLSVRLAERASEEGVSAFAAAGSAILAFEDDLGRKILSTRGSARLSYDGAVAAAGSAAHSDAMLGLAAAAGSALRDPSPQKVADGLKDFQLSIGNGIIDASRAILGAHERATYGWIEGSEAVPPRVITALYGIGRTYAALAAAAPGALARAYDGAILAWVEETPRVAERIAGTQLALGGGILEVASGEAFVETRSGFARALDTRVAPQSPRASLAAASAAAPADMLAPLRSLALFVYESLNRAAGSALALFLAPVAPELVFVPAGDPALPAPADVASGARSSTPVSRIVNEITQYVTQNPVTYVYGGVTREYVRDAIDNLRDDLRDRSSGSESGLADLTGSSLEDLGDVAAMTKDWGDLLFWNGSEWADIATSSLGIAGGSGSPGGSDTEVQFNDGGAFGGSASFTFNTSTARLTVANLETTNATTTNASSTNSYALSMTAGSLVSGDLTVTGSGTIAYASSTAISAPTICIGTDCRTSWPSGGGAGGAISTSSPETAGYVPYWTSTNGTPAALGSDSGFQYNAAADRLTLVNASSTAFSSGYASTTRFGINGELFTDLTGTGLQNVGGALTINATGDWTGTFDGQEGAYYLANSFSTTSANYWQTTRDFFSTTSANYWETQAAPRTADDLTNNSIEDLNDVAAMTENFGDLLGWNGSTWTDFATSSLGLPTFADLGGYATFAYPFPSNATSSLISFNGGLLSVGSTTINGNATTTGMQGVGSLFINSERFTDLTGTGLQNVGGALTINATGDWTGTFDGLEGSAYLANAFSTTSAQYFAHSSTTIPKTYTANTFTASQVLNGGLTLGNLNGPLQANNGFVSATSSIGVLYGGTGLTSAPTYGQLLMGNGSGGYALTATSSLGLPTFAYLFPSNATSTLISFNGGLLSVGSTTVNGNATTTGQQGVGSLFINTERFTDLTGTGLQNVGGALTINATGDWTGTFDGQEGSYYLARGNHTGTQLSSTISDFDTAVNAYVAGSTTIPKTYTANTFTAAQVLSGGLTLGTLNGPLQANQGVVSATTSIGVLYGGTGLTSAPSYGQVLVGNGSGGYTLTATSSLGISASGGLSSYDAWTHPAAGRSATTSLMLFNGAASSTQLSATQAYFGGTATSTFTSAGYLGIGSSSPILPLSIQGNGVYGGFQYSMALASGNTNGPAILFTGNQGYDGRNWQIGPLGSGNTALGSAGGFSIADRTAGLSRLLIDSSGNVGIGTSTPATKLQVYGAGLSLLRIESSSGEGAMDFYEGPTVRGYFGFGDAGDIFTGGASDTMRLRAESGIHLGVGDNAQHFTINSSGNVGIGTTTPTWLLNPMSSSASQLALSAGAGIAQWAFRNAGGNLYLATTTVAGTATTTTPALSIMTASGNVGVGTSSPWGALSIQTTGAGGPALAIGSSTSATTLVIGSNGYLGIGTSSPTKQLVITASGVPNSDAGIEATYFGDTATAGNTRLTMRRARGTVAAPTAVAAGDRLYVMNGAGYDGTTFVTGAQILADVETGATVSTGIVPTFLAFYTMNTSGSLAERFRVSSAGNIGIGTSTPNVKLDVYGAGGTGGLSVAGTVAGLATANAFYADNNAGDTRLISVGANSSTNGSFSFVRSGLGASGFTTSMKIDTSGNIGIGTSSPAAKLDIRALTYANNQAGGILLGNTTNALFDYSLYVRSDGSGVPRFSISAPGATDSFVIDSTGKVGIGISGPSQSLTISSAGTREGYPTSALFSDSTDTAEGIFLGYSSTGNYGIIAASRLGSAWHNIALAPGGGNVGIGSTSPNANLTVQSAGSVGNVAMGTWAGSAGYGAIYLNSAFSNASNYNFLSAIGDALYINRPSSTAIRFRENNGGTDQFTLLSGGAGTFPDGNLSVCTGGACPSGSPAGNGNLIAETAIGIASSTPWAGLSLASGKAIVVGENTLATSTSMTVDWRNGNQQLIRIGGSATTISFSGFVDGQKLVLTVCNPGSTAGAISWGTQVLWSGGTAPTQTTTANKCDVWSFLATRATSTLKIFGTQSANF